MKAKFFVVLTVCALVLSCCELVNVIYNTVDDSPIFVEHSDTESVEKPFIESLGNDTSYPYEEIPDTTAVESAEIIPEETPETAYISETEVVEETVYAEEIVIIPVYNYAEWELDLLARLIFAEGGTESYETQLKIGSVVMNRVDSPIFPNTIWEVIYQESQFSVTFVEHDGVVLIDYPADEEAKKAAYEILTYGSILPADVQVFFLSGISSDWVATREPYGTFGNVTFAYIYKRGDK